MPEAIKSALEEIRAKKAGKMEELRKLEEAERALIALESGEKTKASEPSGETPKPREDDPKEAMVKIFQNKNTSMSQEEMKSELEAIGIHLKSTTVKSYLSSEKRFMRFGKHTYGLRAWRNSGPEKK